MKASTHASAFIYGLGLITLVVASVGFADLPTRESVRTDSALQRTPPPTLTPVVTPDLTATLFFTQTQTAVAQTATAAATQTAVVAATQTAARGTALAQTATAAVMQTIIAQTATSAARTAVAQTATARARTPTVPPPTATPLFTITPLVSGGGAMATVTPLPPSALPATGSPLSWLIVSGVLILIALGARYLRGSAR